MSKKKVPLQPDNSESYTSSQDEAPTASSTSALDIQIGGRHYRDHGSNQPWLIAESWLTPEELRGAFKATALFYILRERDKGGLEDLKKARHTLQIYEEILSRKDPNAPKD